MVEQHVARPSGPLDPESVRAVLRPGVDAVDCRRWAPVFHEGVRELLRMVHDSRRQLLLFEIHPGLSVQLSLLGVRVSEGRAIVRQMDSTIVHCPACGGMLRLSGEVQFDCAHCKKRLALADGAVLAS
jgi:hypothetical protein